MQNRHTQDLIAPKPHQPTHRPSAHTTPSSPPSPSPPSRPAAAMGLPELWTMLGPGLAGAVFGGGWWFWVDAVVCSDIKVPFLHYLPGIFATIAALMFNGVRRDELTDYSPFDDNEGCRSRTWLFLAYVIAFTSLAGSVGMLVQDALLPTTPDTWTGIAGVLQCFFCLASGLMYWTSRTSSDY